MTDPSGNIIPVEQVPVDSLKFHPRNYKRHPDDQLQHIMASIAEHGFYRNVVIARDNTILAGQGVVQATVRLGLTELPVIRLDLDPNEPRALKVLTGDNEIGRLAEVDDRALTDLLKDIMLTDELAGTGFDEEKLAGLVMITRPESEIKNLDEASEWVGMPDYERLPEPYKLIVSFRTMEDRDKLLDLMGATFVHKRATGEGKGTRTWSCWYPERKEEDHEALRFDFEGEQP